MLQENGGRLSPKDSMRKNWHFYILITLGVAHFSGTLYDWLSSHPLYFSPIEPSLTTQLSIHYVRLLPWWSQSITLWDGNLGLNMSAALGFLFAGLLPVIISSRPRPSTLRERFTLSLALCLYTWAMSLVAWTCWFYGPATGFTLASLKVTKDLLALRTQLSVCHSPDTPAQLPSPALTSARLLRFGAIPVLVAGFSHLCATLLFPELFAPLSTELIDRLVHIPISL